MSEPAIRVDGLGKKYRIGARQKMNRTFREAVVDAATAPFRRLKSLGQASHREEDSIWALKDVSFEVPAGEVLGVIGSNGAGKSTLLKILTQITYPTEGRIELRGRVSSLLEVGTGFHRELTGRENVFLNGAILGMKRHEIEGKFDEIVEFSGIDKFIDTPVKRYSSGMHVRLAFAVAAHLEPEILLVDEVLAVGDAEFRKKCIGKMNDVASKGRTVLFVSHSMAAIESLCSRVMLLREGRIAAMGATAEMIEKYLGCGFEDSGDVDLSDHSGRVRGLVPVLRRFRVLDEKRSVQAHVPLGGDVTFEISGVAAQRLKGMTLAIWIMKSSGQRIATCHSGYQFAESVDLEGDFTVCCTMKNCRLMPGPYALSVVLKSSEMLVDQVEGVTMEVTPKDVYGTGRVLPARTGSFVPEVEWIMKNANE